MSLSCGICFAPLCEKCGVCKDVLHEDGCVPSKPKWFKDPIFWVAIVGTAVVVAVVIFVAPYLV